MALEELMLQQIELHQYHKLTIENSSLCGWFVAAQLFWSFLYELVINEVTTQKKKQAGFYQHK